MLKCDYFPGVLVTKSCPTLATPRTVAFQASLSWDSPGKNTGVGCHFLLQGIFPTQESNLGLLHCRRILYWLSYEESSRFLISHSETIPLSKITTSILIFPSFHLLPNLVSNPQAKLILFPLVSEMFLFRAVIRVYSFILLVSFAWPIEHF